MLDKLLLLEEFIPILGSAQQVYKVYRMNQRSIRVKRQGNIDIYPLYLIILFLAVVYHEVVYLSLYDRESIRSIQIQLMLFAYLFYGQPEGGVVIAVKGSLRADVAIIDVYLLSVDVSPYVEVLNAYLCDLLDIEKYLEFEFVFQIFVLDEDRIEVIIDFDVPGQEDEFSVVIGVEVEIEVLFQLDRVFGKFFYLQAQEVVVELLPVFLAVEQPQLQFLLQKGGVCLFDLPYRALVVQE